MPTHKDDRPSRRHFLRFLAGSPLLACAGMAATSPASSEIAASSETMNVFDLEDIARKNLPPAHFGYIATGVDDDVTLRANREGFLKFKIRSRRLVDTRTIDMRIRIFNAEWPTPIILAPAGSQRAFHEEGELATAKAARVHNHLQILSTMTTVPIQEVAAAEARLCGISSIQRPVGK